MANNNNLLFNAALAAFCAAAVQNRNIVDPTAADYSALVQQAITFATEVDSKIANDGTISGGAGVTLAPTTEAIQDAQLSKSGLMREICMAVRGQQFQAPPVPATAASFTVQAAAIAALYTEAIAQLATG